MTNGLLIEILACATVAQCALVNEPSRIPHRVEDGKAD